MGIGDIFKKANEAAKDRAVTPSGHVRGYVAAVFRTTGFIMLATGLAMVIGQRPILKLIPLVLLAFAMFSYPSNLAMGRQRGEDIGLAMCKIALGIALAVMFVMTFDEGLRGGGGRMDYLYWSFVCLSFGFFATVVPENLGEDTSGNSIDLNVHFKGLGSGSSGILAKLLLLTIIVIFGLILWGIFGTLFSAVFVFGGGQNALFAGGIAGLFVGLPLIAGGFAMGKMNEIAFSFLVAIGVFLGALGLSGTMFALIVFIAIVSIGALGGLPVADARPMLGVPILFIALIGATAAYPSIMGQAVFGQWWEPVYAQIQGIQQSMQPMFNQFQGVQTSLGRGWTCLASPTECYKMYSKPQAQVSKTYRALAISQLSATGLGGIHKPPAEYSGTVLLSTLEVENMLSGQNIENPPTIEDVNITTHRIYDAVHKERTYHGPEEIIVGKNPRIKGGICSEWGTSCNGTDFSPGMKARYTVNMSTDLFYKNIEPNNYLKYGVDITYPIETHSVLDVEVMDHDRFNRLIQKDEIEFESPTSTYEWGPVSVAIGVGQQPVQAGSTVPLVVYIKNRGQGYLKSVESFEIRSNNPEFAAKGDISNCSEDFTQYFVDDLSQSLKDWREEHSEEGISSWGVPPKKEVSGQCLIRINELEDADLKTFGLTADMEYVYQLSKTDTVEVMYECTGKDDCDDDEWCNITHGVCVVQSREIDCEGGDDCPEGWECMIRATEEGFTVGYCSNPKNVFTREIPSGYKKSCDDFCQEEKNYDECDDDSEKCLASSAYWDHERAVDNTTCGTEKRSLGRYEWTLGCCSCKNETS